MEKVLLRVSSCVRVRANVFVGVGVGCVAERNPVTVLLAVSVTECVMRRVELRGNDALIVALNVSVLVGAIVPSVRDIVSVPVLKAVAVRDKVALSVSDAVKVALGKSDSDRVTLQVVVTDSVLVIVCDPESFLLNTFPVDESEGVSDKVIVRISALRVRLGDLVTWLVSVSVRVMVMFFVGRETVRDTVYVSVAESESINVKVFENERWILVAVSDAVHVSVTESTTDSVLVTVTLFTC